MWLINTALRRPFTILVLVLAIALKRGASINNKGVDLVEVFGDLAAGDVIAVRGTDELRAGTKVNTKPIPQAGK